MIIEKLLFRLPAFTVFNARGYYINFQFFPDGNEENILAFRKNLFFLNRQTLTFHIKESVFKYQHRT